MRQLTGIALVAILAGGLIGMERASMNDPKAVRLLEDAVNAPMMQDYTAQATSFANYGDRVLQTEAIVYNARGGRRRIEYLLGSLAGVIAGRCGPGRNWRYDPISRSIEGSAVRQRSRASRGDPNGDPCLRMLMENCRMHIVKSTQVAGRSATEIFLQPKGAGGSRTLWIDNETGVILHSEERNSEGELVTATV